MKKEWKTEQEKPQSIVVLRDSNGNSNEYVLPQGFYVARCVGGFEMIYDADSNFYACKCSEDGFVIFRGDVQIPIFKKNCERRV